MSEYQIAEAATGSLNEERRLGNDPDSHTSGLWALASEVLDDSMARSPEQADSPLSVEHTQRESDDISQTKRSIQNDKLHAKTPLCRISLDTKGAEYQIQRTPPTFKSRLEAIRQRRIKKEQQSLRRQQNYRYTSSSDIHDADPEVDMIRSHGHITVSMKQTVEGQSAYRDANADNRVEPQLQRSEHLESSWLTNIINEFPDSPALRIMEDLATKRHLDEDFEQTDMSSTYARYSAKKMGNGAGDIATQGRLCFLDDEASVIADTPKESSDNTSEVHENMTGENLREAPSLTTSLLSKTFHSLLTILSLIGIMESHTRPGYTRVKWKNGRGKWLYDDYVEHVPGALEDMKGFLKSSAYVTAADVNGGHHHVSASSTPPDNSTLHESQTQYSTSSDTVDQLQHSNVFPTNDSQTDVELGERLAHPPVLLSCLKNGTYAVELRQESIIGIADDRQLFHRLRRIYHDHRGRLRPIWSLKTLHSIRFMKFAYGGARYIDMRCHEEICEPGRPCLCVPPEHLVLPKGKEYDCRPIPPRLSPPIGPQLMMDFFMHPEYISPNSTLIVQQLPKRACGKLHGEYGSLTEAWGIYYKEDWNWAKIWWILAFGFFPPGLLFGVLWTVYKQDISGGFGVASWWMAGASIIVGILSTYDM